MDEHTQKEKGSIIIFIDGKKSRAPAPPLNASTVSQIRLVVD